MADVNKGVPSEARMIPCSAIGPRRGMPMSRTVCIMAAVTLCATRAPVIAAQGVIERRLSSPASRSTEEFTQVIGIRELSGGRTLVADSRERRLVVIDWQSSVVSPVGRVGSGPGEYRNVHRLFALDADSTLLTDGTSRRWFILKDETIVATLPAHSPLNELLGPSLLGADRDGNVLGVVGYSWSNPTPVRDALLADTLLVIRANRNSARLDTVTKLRGRGGRWDAAVNQRGARRTLTTNPLPFVDQSILFQDGWIAIARSTPYSVDWFSPRGTLIRGKALPFGRLAVNEREKCFALKRQSKRSQNFECRPELVQDWPSTIPAFLPDALLATPDGMLVIARTPTARENSITYDVVDRGSVLRMRLILRPNERIVGFGSQAVYVAVLDDNDIERLARYSWPP